MSKIKKTQKETRSALSIKIKDASENREELRKLEDTVTRHYDAGTLTAANLAQLDTMIMKRLANLM